MRYSHRNILLTLFTVIAATLCCVQGRAQTAYTLLSDHAGNAARQTQDDVRQMAKILYRNNQPLGIRYTKKHPLIIVADWTFKPYTFINDHGEPDGFQIEIFRSIFEKMHVPYEIRMMNWAKAKREVESGRAHLMMAISSPGATRNVLYGREVIGEYQMAIMHLKTTEHLRSLLLLGKDDTIHCKPRDYGDQYIQTISHGDSMFHYVYLDPMHAQQYILDGKIKYYIWGRSALRNIVRRYGMTERVDVDPIDIPAGQFRFASTDSVLLYELDMQFQHLKAKGEYERIVNRWLSDEPVEESSDGFFEIIVIVTLLIILVAVFFVVVILQRNSSVANLKDEFLAISKMAIDLTSCQVLAISVRRMWVYNISGDFLPKEGLGFHDYEQLIHPEDINVEYEARKAVDNNASEMPTIQFRIRKYNDTTEDWRTMQVHAFIKKNRRGRPIYIYLVLVDVTDRVREQAMLDHTLHEFAAITEISDIGMIYYDRKGNYVNCNRTLIRMFDKGGTGRAEQFIQKTTMQEMPVILNGITVEQNMHMWFCAPVDIPELGLHTTMEVRIQSVYDDKHNHRGYAIAVLDMEDNIRLKRDLSHIFKRLAELKSDLTRYQMELRFLLRRNKMNTFRWVAGTDYLEVSRDLLSFDTRIPLSRYFNAIIDPEKDAYKDVVNNPSAYFSKPINAMRKYKMSSHDDDSIRWYSVNVIPEYDEKNRFIGAFGMRCDVTDFMESQERLRNETEKAEDSGRQKALFLANMTHELRTPLNAINGFAEIMQLFSTPEEKEEYIHIMSHNCTMLISLIDNILQLSMMDTDGIKLHERGVDFAVTFQEEAHKMQHYFTNPEVKYLIDSPMKSLFVTIDIQRVIQILDALVNNAAKFTKKGFVRVGYRSLGNTLTIYCRDTGCGIPKDKQEKVFERFVKLDDFVQGTGLGLSVCKVLAERMGATIDLYSREGEGTTISINFNI